MNIAGVLLELPDKRFVLQRRDSKAPASPGLLGFFGGKIEAGETALQAAARELSEETTIEVAKLELKKLAIYKIPEPQPDFAGPKIFNLFEAKIDNTDFDVLEGVGWEAHTEAELMKRKDLSPSVNYYFRNLRSAG